MKVTDNKVFFWASPLGNWSRVKDGILVPSELSLSGEKGSEFRLPTSEHVFMFLKARFFRDIETAKKIMEVSDPREAKKLGREVKGFDEKSWEGYREIAMMTALRLRYKADLKFREFLHQSRFDGKNFVEANPYDKIWSCGYLEDDPRCDMPENTWPGLNLLGKLLDRLRDETAARH